MADCTARSRLKRKKSSADELHANASPPRTGRLATVLPKRPVSTSGSVAPAAPAWWSRPQLPAVERLWALTLSSAGIHLGGQCWEPFPDLPSPSAARAAAVALRDQRWCDLSADVPPFPESRPTALRRHSSQQETSEEPGAAAHPPDCSQRCGQRPPQHQREEGVTTSAGTSDAGLEKRGAVSKELGADCLSKGPAPLQREEDCEEKVVVNGEEEECGSNAGGGGRLQTCPMCLQVFPAGFTQMDCDSHLAQCLSEMTVDMTW